jgi:hypothetical protein
LVVLPDPAPLHCAIPASSGDLAVKNPIRSNADGTAGHFQFDQRMLSEFSKLTGAGAREEVH